MKHKQEVTDARGCLHVPAVVVALGTLVMVYVGLLAIKWIIDTLFTLSN